MPPTPPTSPSRLLNCYASGLVEFSLAPANFEMTITEKPIAWPYARLRARTGEKITNQRLETIALSEPSRLVLQNLDGAHDRAALIDILTPWVQEAQKKLAAKQAQAKSAQSNPTELKSPTPPKHPPPNPPASAPKNTSINSSPPSPKPPSSSPSVHTLVESNPSCLFVPSRLRVYVVVFSFF